MRAVGLKTHIWNNNLRAGVLLALFPVLLMALAFGLVLVLMGLGLIASTGDLGADLARAGGLMVASTPLALGVAGLWFAIAWFVHQGIIDGVTGARPVDRSDEPDLYALLETLCISRGLATPTLRIIEQEALNAYASGLSEGRYSITLTRGLAQALDRDEIEAVLAHELTHIINRDVRTLVIAAVFAGIISLVAEVVFRGLRHAGRGSGRNSKGQGALLLVGLAIVAVGWLLSAVIRMTLSRTREYVADAGAVELTKNPDAMISALRKVAGRADLGAPDELAGLFLEHDEPAVLGLLATHPPIEKRIQALVAYAGGRDPVAAAVPLTG